MINRKRRAGSDYDYLIVGGGSAGSVLDVIMAAEKIADQIKKSL